MKPKPRHERPTAELVVQTIKSSYAQNLPPGSRTYHTVLKAGPQTYKTASILEVASRTSGLIARQSLSLTDYNFTPSGGIDFKNPTAHWTCDNNDHTIDNLRAFLASVVEINSDGTHAVIKLSPTHKSTLQGLVSAINSSEIDLQQLGDLVSALSARKDDLKHVSSSEGIDARRMVAAALRTAHRAEALERLRYCIQHNVLEQEFQDLLTANWWMLGGRYIRRIPQRDWTNEDTVDIMLQTADCFFELIELKRASANCFIKDHDTIIVSSEINKAVNQVAHYISQIEATRDNLHRRYGFDFYKLRAKVIIGQIDDKDPQTAEKREAIRRYNAHLHGIEVITYDQLERIAAHVVESNQSEAEEAPDSPTPDEPSDTSDEIPF